MVVDGKGRGIHEGRKFRYWRLKTAKPVKQFNIRVTLRIEQDPTVEAWEKAVVELETKTSTTANRDRKRTADWWKAFWDRSYIVINPGNSKSDLSWKVGRNYQLFRAMLAANRSGRFPTLFNGGAFLCEEHPDRRQWGHAGFTAQNQRLVYWPLLKTGDTD